MEGQPVAWDTPGVAFLRRRIERAAAVPPQERNPEVAAFVESAQLVREVCQLLPLTRTGRPALQSGKVLQRQLLLTQAKLARAALVLPATVPGVGDCNTKRHLDAYMGHINTMAVRVQQRQLDGPALPFALLAHNRLRETAMARDHFGAVSQGRNLAQMLGEASFQQAFDQEMQQLAGSEGRPLFTARQLEYSCCCIVAQRGVAVMDGLRRQWQKQQLDGEDVTSPLLEAQEAAVREVASWSSEAMLRLEPEQPQSWFLAAAQQTDRHRPESLCEALEMNARAIQLAQQQRSNLWVLQAGTQALMLVAVKGSYTDVDRATLESALALVQQLPSELKRCRWVLPEAWVKLAEALVATSQDYAAIIQGNSQRLLHTGSGTGSSSASTAGNDSLSLKEVHSRAAAVGRATVGFLDRKSCKCHGCGRQAMGLRKCARCRQAHYCRWVHLAAALVGSNACQQLMASAVLCSFCLVLPDCH
jgi:hypothetical protein